MLLLVSDQWAVLAEQQRLVIPYKLCENQLVISAQLERHFPKTRIGIILRESE